MLIWCLAAEDVLSQKSLAAQEKTPCNAQLVLAQTETVATAAASSSIKIAYAWTVVSTSTTRFEPMRLSLYGQQRHKYASKWRGRELDKIGKSPKRREQYQGHETVHFTQPSAAPLARTATSAIIRFVLRRPKELWIWRVIENFLMTSKCYFHQEFSKPPQLMLRPEVDCSQQ